MTVRNPIIPFSWWPASWGLRGKTRQIAEAEYRYDGIDLDYALVNIENSDADSRGKARLKVDLKHNRITQYEYDCAILEKETHDENTKLRSILEIEFKHGKISQPEYERKLADINQEPWVAMPKVSWNPADPGKTFFDIDYNEFFVQDLRNHGYQGTETEIIDTWMNDICSAVADEMSQQQMPDTFVSTVKKVRVSKDRTEHS